MDKMENFEELRRKMMWIFENKREIPTEVEQTIQTMFNQLKEKYKEMGCYSGTIQEYIQGNLDELLVRLQRGVGNRRKDEQYEDIQAFLLGVQRELEEELDSEEQKRMDNQNRDRIGEIANDSPANIRATLNTIDLVEEALRDVQLAQNRILDSRGLYGWSQIDEMSGEIQYYIRQLRSKNEEKIHDEFQADNDALRKELMQAFEQYLAERGEEEPDKTKVFKDGLSKGVLSLEEQRKAAEKRALEGLFELDSEDMAKLIEDIFR